MKLRLSGLFFELRQFAVMALATILVAGSGSMATADSWGGSWGGSSGGSSGGSWGGSSGGSSGGLFAGRRPIRNLLGRIGDRIHGNRGGFGSSGGSSGGSVGYVSHGSFGSSGGSSGGFHGSSGGFGSHGSTMGYSLGSVGHSVPITSGYLGTVPMMHSPGNIMTPGPVMTSPAGDADEFRPVDGINFEGSNGSNNYYPPANPTDGNNDFDGSTRVGDSSTTALTLRLPAEAKVYINDQMTRTPGDVRKYVAKNLTPGQEYFYHVKAVIERDGKETVRSEMVSIPAGGAKVVDFDFSNATTTLALNVPEDAQVKLCGKETKAVGKERYFSTERLSEGESWEGYLVEVTIERDGKTYQRQQEIQLVGGGTYQLNFEFDSASDMLAVK